MTTPSSSIRLLLASLVIAAASAEAGCSSDTASGPSASSTSSSGGSSSGSPTISSADCTSRCAAKSSACGAPSETAQQGCTQLCGEPRTEAQLTCLEEKDCGSLARTEDLDTLCPAGGTGSSTSSSSSSTSSSSSSSGSSGNPPNNLPTTLTITGHFGTVKATHVKQDLTLVSFLSVAPQPTFSPSKPSTLPDLSDKTITSTVTSPSLGACKARISYVLNSSQIVVMIEGTETLPATDCATFTDAVTKQGFKATLTNVPYPGGTPKATVTVDVSP